MQMIERSLFRRRIVKSGLFAAGCIAATASGQFVGNDNFADAWIISPTNEVVYGVNQFSTRENGEPAHAGEVGGSSVWWSWTAPGNGLVYVSTRGSTFDTLLGIYQGESVSSLVEIASNDDDPAGYLTSYAEFTAAAGRKYAIAVDGYGGATGAIELRLAYVGPPPPAPAWALPDPFGVPIHSTDFGGKVVLLNFWATWCGPCKSEMPDLVALHAKYSPDGFAVIGADVSETAQDVRRFLATFTPVINYPVIMATSSTMTDYGGIGAIPTSFIIDRQNRIRAKFVGTRTAEVFEQTILPLLYNDVQMAAEADSGGMTLHWPVTVAPFTVDGADSLVNPVWTPIAESSWVADGSNWLHLPITESGTRFFRLRLSN